jgi:hypothetical protein
VNEVIVLAAQRPAVDALAQIAAAFGHLPAVCFDLGDIYPDRLDISVHDNLGHFEVWRCALGIAADAVEYGTFGSKMYLSGRGSFAGATVKLTGYAASLPAPAPAVVSVGGAE